MHKFGHHRKRKKHLRPTELNRVGPKAIAWLPLAGGSIFHYASANPSRNAGSAADVPGMRIPAVSASPLGSKWFLFFQPLTEYAY